VHGSSTFNVQCSRYSDPWRRGNPRFVGVIGTTNVIDCLYPVNVGLIRQSRVINIAGDISSNDSYARPTASTGRGLVVTLRRHPYLIATLDDEVNLVVRIV
jgi:hypothetical protein